MLIKAGVDISRLNREIRRALHKIQVVLNEFVKELIITSTYEGTHGEGSLHYRNDAIDIRIDHPNVREIKEGIKEKLGKNYDVVYEGDHIHVEYDPK
jgi:hypothetical protein